MQLSAEQLADRRIATAKREAERGFAACVACGFKNFSRLVHCALCGLSSAPSPELPVAVQSSGEKSSEGKVLPLLPVHKRKEWTRQLDPHSRLVWHRRRLPGGDYSPGYLLRFELPPEAEPEADSFDLQHRERSLSTGYDPSSGVQFELLEPRDVVPTKFPLLPAHGDLADTTDDLKKLAVDLAAQDFPTKYAYFIANATALLQSGGRNDQSSLSVHRDYILEQSTQHINCIREANIRSAHIDVNFIGEGEASSNEKGTGGLHREWLTLLNERLVDPTVGLFTCTQRSDQTYFINAQSKRVLGPDHLQHFRAAGRLVGRAMLEGAVLNFHLCVPLLKIMLGTPVTFADLEELDADMYRSLTWLLDNDGAEALELDFTVTQCHNDHGTQTVELIPAGRNIEVNDDNKFEFVDRTFRFTLFESVAPQLAAFLKGFYEVVPQRLLLLFDYEELDYLLCGSDKIDVSDWQQHTRLALESRREVTWFWDVVKDMPSIYQQRLLQFSTGCSRVPLVGFQGLTSYDGQLCEFTLTDANATGYFRSHACHNILELPCFTTKDELRSALYAALHNEASNCDGRVL
ncbi:hypothetical protein JM18_003383 [Phytophthora kernoviae]|uniref:HECT-type E3 ubiquitin transferase n=2 Tax=Phytophthora kernoviae TaxID=325452 RepID=A0A8T0M3C5_9STRA|nr:hypothetical protein G195_003289 [Phytophthora kernoviae 00238/432]KAG2526544.1 hypothetical protein JM16_002723 [Phytophthora kernoviae]KAG2528124.1 hypothetical protein JM18_003383 [Phytophthora kernoviae]